MFSSPNFSCTNRPSELLNHPIRRRPRHLCLSLLEDANSFVGLKGNQKGNRAACHVGGPVFSDTSALVFEKSRKPIGSPPFENKPTLLDCQGKKTYSLCVKLGFGPPRLIRLFLLVSLKTHTHTTKQVISLKTAQGSFCLTTGWLFSR